MHDGTNLVYFAQDHLSSTSIVMDTNGEPLSQNRYMPFGEIRDNIASSPITQTDFGYTGQRNIASMGLMDYRYRFLSTRLGRFIQPDSIIPNPSNPQAWNRYSYTLNNPVKYIDPTGHKSICLDGLQCFDDDPGKYVHISTTTTLPEAYNWFDRATNDEYKPPSPPDPEDEVTELDHTLNKVVIYGGVGLAATGVAVGFGAITYAGYEAVLYKMGLACLQNPICRLLIGAGGSGTAAEVLDDVKFPENPGQIDHIFRDAAGHMAEDTLANRQLLIDTVSSGNFIETTEHGVDVYAQLLDNGTEVWVQVYNNVISNGGINSTPIYSIINELLN